MEANGCPQWVSHGGRAVTGQRCGRPVREEGLCGIHLAAKRKRESNGAAREAERLRDDQLRSAAEALCERLAECGIDASPYWGYSFHSTGLGYTGGVVVGDPTTATRLVEMVEESTG